MIENLLKEIAIFTGPLGSLILFSISTVSMLSICILFFIEKEKNRIFLIILLFISISLLGYLISNFLLTFHGIDTGDRLRIERNKNTIILLSKLEILSLVTAILSFSCISLFLVRGAITKIKFIIVFLVGAVIVYLNFFSDQFFLKDTLKLEKIYYLAKEGPLFDIFVAYFGATVSLEIIYLTLSKNKIKHEYLEIYNQVMSGFLGVIVFGVLEVLELYGVTRFYPYAPSLLGMGIVMFSIVVLILLINRYSLLLNENRVLVRLLNETKDNISLSNDKMLKNVKEVLTFIRDVENKIEETFNLPEITKSLAEETTNSLEKTKTIANEIRSESLQILHMLNENLQHIKLELDKFYSAKIGEIIHSAIKKEREVLNSLKNLSLLLVGQKQMIEILKSMDLSTQPLEIFKITENIENYIEENKVQTINLLIIGEKNKDKYSEFSTIIANEILNRLTLIENTLKKAVESKEKLLSLQKDISETLHKTIDDLTNQEEHTDTEKTLETIEQLLSTHTNTSKDILNLTNIVDQLSSNIVTTSRNIEELTKNVEEIFSFSYEAHTIYEQLLGLTEKASEIRNTILSIRKEFEEFKSLLGG
ncbi:MAG: hypothetical protein ABDH28_02805 [Brevinematia bacterium]